MSTRGWELALFHSMIPSNLAILRLGILYDTEPIFERPQNPYNHVS